MSTTSRRSSPHRHQLPAGPHGGHLQPVHREGHSRRGRKPGGHPFQDAAKFSVDFPYLLAMLQGSFMSRRNTIVVPGGKMVLAMELILLPIISRMMDRRLALIKRTAGSPTESGPRSPERAWRIPRHPQARRRSPPFPSLPAGPSPERSGPASGAGSKFRTRFPRNPRLLPVVGVVRALLLAIRIARLAFCRDSVSGRLGQRR